MGLLVSVVSADAQKGAEQKVLTICLVKSGSKRIKEREGNLEKEFLLFSSITPIFFPLVSGSFIFQSCHWFSIIITSLSAVAITPLGPRLPSSAAVVE